MQNTQQKVDFSRIKQAIEYIDERFREQPDLDSIARKINMSPFHFQRMFQSWAGISPKKFLQYTTLSYAKSQLSEQLTLFETSARAGLSGASRLHDLFVSFEAMTPAEFRDGGKLLTIQYTFSESLFGTLLVASTDRGICRMEFSADRDASVSALKKEYPNALILEKRSEFHDKALGFFTDFPDESEKLPLHLRGTPFQLKVWEGLLKIPPGGLITYGDLASQIHAPEAARAVGSAIGKNPVAYIIPCHRVIQATGAFGGYMWGTTRKKAIIAWEHSRLADR